VARRRRSTPAFLVGAEHRRFAPALDTGDSLRILTGANTPSFSRLLNLASLIISWTTRKYALAAFFALGSVTVTW